MTTIPTVADMLSIIGVAFLITVVLTALVGVAAQFIGTRREAHRAEVHPIPTQRQATTHEHAHAA